jgi:pyruvate dehydrogenase E1 component
MNITHQQKKMGLRALMGFRDRLDIPVSDEELEETPFYRPPEDSPEIRYLKERREALGGYLPARTLAATPLDVPDLDAFDTLLRSSRGREFSTTMAFVRLFTLLTRNPAIRNLLVPIVADEARTFGMEGMFRQLGIYAPTGQLYEPVDAHKIAPYREARDGQILQEGINEAGSLCSWMAAGTSAANHGFHMIPFFIFYSMFGLQRFGDLAYAAGDARTRGFLIGATAGRTTLNGEGLQHQDGHSHLLASVIPNLVAYDPAYAYEVAVIVQDGIRRMHEENEDIFFYITVENEAYPQPPMPPSEEVRGGILRGLYRIDPPRNGGSPEVRLFGSGPILNEVRRAQQLLHDDYGVNADVWSVTSYTELRREAQTTERWNRLHPLEDRRLSYLETALGDNSAPIVASTDYLTALPDLIARWLPGPLTALGTDGFGRSDTRAALRDFFEIDARHVAWSALSALGREGVVDGDVLVRARDSLQIDPNRLDPMAR